MNKQEIINEFKKYINEENTGLILQLIEKIESKSDEEVIKKMEDEKIIDGDGKFNSYMLERYITQGIKIKNRRQRYTNENGENTNPFEYKNKLVMLEKTIEGEPIEMHIASPLPEELKKGEMLTLNGNKILKLAFCDALLKIREQWKNDERKLAGADELKLISFMINKKTADFLKELGFDAKSVRLIPTDYKNPPEIDEDKLTNQDYEKLSLEFAPYIDKYAVHKDAKGELTQTKQMGIATMPRDWLMSEKAIETILSVRKNLIQDLLNKRF